jgi:phosphorylcholine metabolism protein LicD
MKEIIARALGRDSVSFRILKFLFGSIYNYIDDSIKIFYFRKSGLKLLRRFDEVMKEAGCEYWLAFGTLLGAIREHDFLKNDSDIDVGVFAADYSENVHKALLDKGFKRTYEIQIVGVDSFGFEETYEWKKVHIDIFIFHKTDIENEVFCHDFLDIVWEGKRKTFSTVRRIYFPLEGLVTYDFLGLKVNIPSNYNSFLRAHYGDTFMWKDPSWSTRTSAAVRIIPGDTGITV